MTMINYSFALLFTTFLLQILSSNSQTPLAPALYIFGDSLSDSGNNNFLQTQSKANYKPYGVDFPSGATGRFTNGKTFVDFIAQSLGLPFPPPYLSLSNVDKTTIATGVNYASGSAGILPETGTAIGDNLSFEEQINYFQDPLLGQKIFKTPAERSKHMSNSIFHISIGSNDYIYNYLQQDKYNSSHIYSPQQFSTLLANGLKQGLMKLYGFGARKFVVFNIGRVGCIPAIANTDNKRTPCAENVHSLILLYNTKLPSMLKYLQRILSGSTFVRGDAYIMNKTSSQAGFSAIQTPCCTVNTNGMCVPNSVPCPDRSKFIVLDSFHPTEVVNQASANDCFSGTYSCVPLNVKQLAQKPQPVSEATQSMPEL
ncbi:hypothetical protein AQUCO_02300193v1 [Aquilegia coerulea]|uniref:Uncharacterized protein n=1 Tax=Aquilegia coerulea TaxID=218851 RepID=A0A2G5DDC4_AQUCA|nr:hypothetical protein AQUCO_02300193v1 [Aquilegia coerulea]